MDMNSKTSDSAKPAFVKTGTSDEAKKMRGADVVVRCLELIGVDTVFAYPGGSAIELNQALSRSQKIRVILPRHEQGGGFMASGYARSTGKPGVCFATSGPGATNLVTTIADAYMDSVPVVFITGQVFSQFIGKQAFQETDFFGMTLPIVKHSFLALDANELPNILFRAFKIATSGRPGPVVIDIPKDIQQAMFVPKFPKSLDEFPAKIPGKLHAMDEELKLVLDLISASKRPVFYVGGGVISAGASDLLREFARITGVPVASTLMGVGAFPANDPQSLYWFGMHGTVAGNWAVYHSDLLVAMGTRFDDRVTGPTDKFAPTAKIVHFDIDRSEHNKNKTAQFPIEGELHDALTRLIDLAKRTNFKKPDLTEWYATINGWKKQHPFPFGYRRHGSPHIMPQEAIEALYQETKGDAIVCTGVGQHQMWTPQYFLINKPRTFISSLGSGTMGFGLPAACGVAAAFPDKTVINVDGDGSVLMNIQELATMAIEKLAVKTVILNNQFLGMVAQWEDCFYGSNRGQTLLGDVHNIGSPDNVSALYPDFVTIAKGFGVNGRRVLKRDELHAAIREMLDTPGPFVLDVVVPYGEHVLPFVPAGSSALDIMTEESCYNTTVARMEKLWGKKS